MRILTWNGRNLPAELRRLPPGRYALQAVDELPILTPEQDAGIEEALESLRRGEGIPAENVHAEIRNTLRKRRRTTKRRK